MKYSGRIALLLISISASIIEFLLGIDIEKAEVYFDIGCAILAWVVGGLYDKLRFLTYKDHLTEVYNRRFVDKLIPKLLKKSKLKRKQLAVFILDINNFKNLNDVYGHHTGDIALKALAELLKTNVRKSDIISRWGGDEFLIITEDTDIIKAQNILQRFNELFEQEINKYPIDYLKLNLGISTGFAIYPDDANTFDKLLSLADKKMYDKKISTKQ